MNNQIEYDFKVGDEVITSTGEVGVIEYICDCSYCRDRGFYEPVVETTLGVGEIYITNYDEANNFKNFYQIGKYKFGNIDKSSLAKTLELERLRLKKVKRNIEAYNRQLAKILELECECDG